MYFGDAELSNDDSNGGHSFHCKAVLNFLDVNNSASGEDFTEPPFLKDFFRAARETEAASVKEFSAVSS